MEKKGAQKEMKEEREGKMPSPYRLSHFVAPLYVAPSPTPGNAKPTSEYEVFQRLTSCVHVASAHAKTFEKTSILTFNWKPNSFKIRSFKVISFKVKFRSFEAPSPPRAPAARG